MAVGQAEVEQDDVEAVLVAALDGRREQLDLDQLERPVPAVAQQIAHHPNVVGIVFDQQDSNAFVFHGHSHVVLPRRQFRPHSNQYLRQACPVCSTSSRNVAGLVT